MILCKTDFTCGTKSEDIFNPNSYFSCNVEEIVLLVNPLIDLKPLTKVSQPSRLSQQLHKCVKYNRWNLAEVIPTKVGQCSGAIPQLRSMLTCSICIEDWTELYDNFVTIIPSILFHSFI